MAPESINVNELDLLKKFKKWLNIGNVSVRMNGEQKK